MSAENQTGCGHNEEHAGCNCHCCPEPPVGGMTEMTRRSFLATAAVGGAILTGLSWARVMAASVSEVPMPGPRKPLNIFPVLVCDRPQRRPMTSWRNWGGIETAEQAADEAARIRRELTEICQKADFPVGFSEVAVVGNVTDVAGAAELQAADVVIVYGAGAAVNGCQDFKKDVILFQRHRSGPVYLQYEIISPRFLRQHTDMAAVQHIRFDDVVTDSMDELTWRLRALCGLKNTRGQKILCIGGPAGWAQPEGVIPNLVREVWNLDMQTVTYEDLGKLILEARADTDAVALARKRAGAYLGEGATKLETKREFVDNCFLLDQVFRKLMVEADCRAITINGCMGTIMPQALTSACLTLSTLNDDGWLAFCESDFVVIPSGLLMANITGKPVFLNDPTYPHDGVITLAHCTGPRKMDGKTTQPARIVTHFESDYGATPKAEWPKGQVLTNIAPDFKSKRWMGLLGEVESSPFLPICRDQIDVRYTVPDQLVAERMPGFHWMTAYGDHRKELGYALRRVGIEWDDLNSVPIA